MGRATNVVGVVRPVTLPGKFRFSQAVAEVSAGLKEGQARRHTLLMSAPSVVCKVFVEVFVKLYLCFEQ